MAILWPTKFFDTKNTSSVRRILSFEFFHKPYNVLELICCTEYLSAGSQKSHSWKLKIRHHHCAGIQVHMFEILCTKFGEFYKKLSDWQQLKDELENSVRKWHWAGHVQKTLVEEFKLRLVSNHWGLLNSEDLPRYDILSKGVPKPVRH